MHYKTKISIKVKETKYTNKHFNPDSLILTIMLLVANLVNTKSCKKTGK